jgi:uncharacterized protein
MPDILSVVSGAVIGLIMGIVGGGGSIIAVPLLLYVVDVPSVHTAIGTSAVAVAVNAFGNLVLTARRGLVKWPCALVFSGAGIAGSYIGSHLALQIPGAKILALFGGLMLVIGTVMLLRKNAEGDADVRLNLKTARHMLPWLLTIGLGVGGLAGFFGIGGGFLIVPGLMLATGMPITYAIGTSLVAVTVFGAVTAGNYALAGEVLWRTVGLFIAGGVVGSLLGQLLSSKLAAYKKILQTMFATFVIAIGIFTIYRGIL